MPLIDDISAWNNEQRNLVIKSYEDKGFKASGNFARQLEPLQTVTPTNVNVKMLGSFYTYYMINGRKPTEVATASVPTLFEMIVQWLKDKGLDLNPYAVTKNIHKYGTKQYYKPSEAKKQLLSDAYTKQNIDGLLKIISEDSIRKIRIETLKILQ